MRRTTWRGLDGRWKSTDAEQKEREGEIHLETMVRDLLDCVDWDHSAGRGVRLQPIPFAML